MLKKWGVQQHGRPVFISGSSFAVKRNPGGSAHELLWNFLPAIQQRRKLKARANRFVNL
jgi:hypothetical protein